MIPLSTEEMNKDGGVSPNDLTILMTQLWCRDHHEYRGNPADRARVQLSAAMLLYCFTSARTGEVHESTARRHGAQKIGEDSEDAELEARVMAACYKVCVEKENKQFLKLTVSAFRTHHRDCGWYDNACTHL